MANALLAHLYTRIRGSQENIAIFSLQYIIMQSDVPDKERLDMVGKDSSGGVLTYTEIIEGKILSRIDY